ncbi:MAG: aminotransferase class IV [Candidatus Omnitrophica bacterium]|nr:aminotransferase class IV [Candidatus Omnitrophota bacterium]
MEEIVFLNGKFILKEQAQLPLISPGFLYGWGLFETMRAYNNKIIYFNEHLERIKNASKLINIRFPYALARLKDYIEQTVRINGFKDTYVRLTLWKNLERITDTLIAARRYKPFSAKKHKQGFSCLVSGFRQQENSFLARLKTTNRLFYQLAYLQAKEKGFDEAIILNNRGYISEASRSNLFMIKDKEVLTPALECGCLGGITQRVICDLAKRHNIKIRRGNFTLQDLYAADAAFLTNSLMGIMPLRSVENQQIGKAKPECRLRCFFIKEYNLLFKNGT